MLQNGLQLAKANARSCKTGQSGRDFGATTAFQHKVRSGKKLARTIAWNLYEVEKVAKKLDL